LVVGGVFRDCDCKKYVGKEAAMTKKTEGHCEEKGIEGRDL
jgi:hypothetical protein